VLLGDAQKGRKDIRDSIRRGEHANVWAVASGVSPQGKVVTETLAAVAREEAGCWLREGMTTRQA
jgi:hypothetical protein